MMADVFAIIRRGQIVAEGSPAELKTQLLGKPFELADPLRIPFASRFAGGE